MDLVLVYHQSHDVLNDELMKAILQLRELSREDLIPVRFDSDVGGSFLDKLAHDIDCVHPVAVILPDSCSNEELLQAVCIAVKTEANPVVFRPRDKDMLLQAVLPLRQLSAAAY